MRYYFAPMEGLTDSIYRRLHHRYFSGVDRYYMPFLSPTIHRSLTHREDRELPMAQSESFVAVPQILTKVPEDFLWAAQVCRDRGYEEGRRLGTWPYLAADLGPWQASQVGLACCQSGQVNLTLLHLPPTLRASVKVTHLSCESFQCLGCPSPS